MSKGSAQYGMCGGNGEVERSIGRKGANKRTAAKNRRISGNKSKEKEAEALRVVFWNCKGRGALGVLVRRGHKEVMSNGARRNKELPRGPRSGGNEIGTWLSKRRSLDIAGG